MPARPETRGHRLRGPAYNQPLRGIRYIRQGRQLAAALAVLHLLLPGPARAVPEARHAHIDCAALRLGVGEHTVRHQLKLILTLTAPDEAELSGAGEARLYIANPAGFSVRLEPSNQKFTPRQFKVATLVLVFKAATDSADPSQNSVPADFFAAPGPYALTLDALGQRYTGEIGFGPQVSLRCEQAGRPLDNFSLAPEQPLRIYTDPPRFGPVYYKRQDAGNFIFQLANMDNALLGGDFHAPIESPQYIFSVRSGPDGGPAGVVDPALYVAGAQEHLIRSDWAETPVELPAGLFLPGDSVSVDFMRQETIPPDALFTSGNPDVTSRAVVQDRVVWAMLVEAAPDAAELGLTAEQLAARLAARVKRQISGS